jgi:receptor protein-tyrosine kinase
MFKALQRSPADEDELIPAIFDGDIARRLPEAVLEQEVTRPAPAPASTARIAATDCDLAAVRTFSVQLTAGSPLFPFDQGHPAAEQYRILRTKLIHYSSSPRMIVISSASAGDGKSVSAINLAGAMALKAETPTLLIDADFRRHALAKYLRLPEGPGLADVLEGRSSLEAALIRVEQIPSLYVLQAGDVRANPSELLDSDAWRNLCVVLRSQFRFLLVDSPPVGAVADFDLLERVADGVLLIVRPDHTPRASCYHAIESVEASKLLGIVVNCAKDWLLYRRKQNHGHYVYGS